MVFVLVGLAFKISVVPFHMWTPDVYEGAPTPVTVFFATAPKVAAMALLLRVMATPFGHLLGAWQLLIIIMSIASMILGTLAAIGQTNIKRLMAYSSIGHMGYALIGLAVGTPEGIRGVLVYMVVYVFMTAGTFACIIAMRRNGRAVEQISDLSGLSNHRSGAGAGDGGVHVQHGRHPVRCRGSSPSCTFSLPRCRADLWTLAVIGVLTSVVGAFYYIRVIKVMYFDAPVAAFDPRPGVAVLRRGGGRVVHHVLLHIPGPDRAGGPGRGEGAVLGVTRAFRAPQCHGRRNWSRPARQLCRPVRSKGKSWVAGLRRP